MDIKSHILLINREKKFLETTRKSLYEAGYPVLTATTMSSALNLLSSNAVKLIICDSSLEDFSGHEFLRFLKKNAILEKIPFVFFVPVHDQGSAGKAFDLGAADFIVYPLDGKIFLERIGEILSSGSGSDGATPPPRDTYQEPSTPSVGMDYPVVVERRESERKIPDAVMNIEVSRDAILWVPGRIKNINQQGFLMETSLLGRPGMLLYIRVPLPKGKCVIESQVRHITISNHRLSADIGVEIEDSLEWTEIYHYIDNLMDGAEKPAAVKPVFEEKKSDVKKAMAPKKPINANTIMLMDYNKTRFADPLLHSFHDSSSEKALERHVALKVISYKLSSIASFREMFVKEARFVSQLNHPNIAEIYYIDQTDDVLYFAMEYISGGTLSALIKDGNLNTAKGLDYFLTTCRTLEFVSRKNIVHRDIKPENIMINDKGILKVVDFGVAIAASDGKTKKRKSDGLVGSPLYVSPDCIMGRPLDCRSDIYSLGATFYHVFSGSPPFEGNDMEEVLLKHLNEELVPLRKRNPVLSGELSRIIEKMMDKNPLDRYQTYQAIMSDLNALMA
jgi:serine/threonine protein kinase/DNA-binding response OmpR family regulator